MKADELVSIGKIGGTHGYKGLLKVLPLTDFPERFGLLKQVYVGQDKNAELMTVESTTAYKGYFLIKFKGIDNKEAAQELTNQYLKVEEKDIYPLPAGQYYHFQLIGLSVFDENNGYLGILNEVLETGANDVYVVRSEQYVEILIPAIKQVISNVDLSENKMLVNLLPGLLENEE